MTKHYTTDKVALVQKIMDTFGGCNTTRDLVYSFAIAFARQMHLSIAGPTLEIREVEDEVVRCILFVPQDSLTKSYAEALYLKDLITSYYNPLCAAIPSFC
jgi:hypothetical protein